MATSNVNRTQQYTNIYDAFRAVEDDLFSVVDRDDDVPVPPTKSQPQVTIEQPVTGTLTTTKQQVTRKQPATTQSQNSSGNKPKMSVGIVGTTCGSILLILMTGTAAWINAQNGAKDNAPSQLQVAEANMHETQRQIVEKLTRTDLDPIAPKNLGWRQQMVASLGQSINNDAAVARATPGDIYYQKTHEATLHGFLMDYVKLANLADMGTTGTLTYQDENGQLVSMPVPSSELFAIALNRVEATIGAQQWREVPATNSRVATTEMMNLLQSYKLQYATWLQYANLVYSADQVKEITTWQQQQEKQAVSAPRSLPPKVQPPAGAAKQAVPQKQVPQKKKVAKPVVKQQPAG